MSRFRGIKGRLGRAEAANDGSSPVPFVMRVPFGETQAEARAAFDADYSPKPGHAVLCVPAKPRTEAEHALWAERFRANQLALVANARRERVAVAETITPLRQWPNSPVIRPNGPRITWKPQA